MPSLETSPITRALNGVLGRAEGVYTGKRLGCESAALESYAAVQRFLVGIVHRGAVPILDFLTPFCWGWADEVSATRLAGGGPRPLSQTAHRHCEDCS